jgi:hypothetical protein
LGRSNLGNSFDYYQGDAYEELPGGLKGKTVPSSSFQSGTHSSDTSEDSDFDPEEDTCGSSGSVPNYHVLEPEDNSIWMCKKLLATLASGLLIIHENMRRQTYWLECGVELLRGKQTLPQWNLPVGNKIEPRARMSAEALRHVESLEATVNEADSINEEEEIPSDESSSAASPAASIARGKDSGLMKDLDSIG